MKTVELSNDTCTIDPLPYMCPGLDEGNATVCPAVIGNVLVYYDTNHITRPFSESMAPAIEELIREAAPHLL